jgi:cysteinyl-tRNA synthetase
VLESYSPAALRLAILNYLYREPFEYSEQAVQAAERSISLLHRALHLPSGSGQVLDGRTEKARFDQALADDFNTPDAISAMIELAGKIVAVEQEQMGIRAAQTTLQMMAEILGLQILSNMKD